MTAPGDGARRDDPPRLGWRVALFAAAFVAVVAWVAAHDGEHAATARHFMRQLLRQLF